MADNIEEQSNKTQMMHRKHLQQLLELGRKILLSIGMESDRKNSCSSKRARSSKKGIVTKAQNEIKDMMLNSNNAKLVKARIKEFKQLVQDLRIPIPLIIPYFATNTKLKNQMISMTL